jgi:hypothetical protein
MMDEFIKMHVIVVHAFSIQYDKARVAAMNDLPTLRCGTVVSFAPVDV